MLVCNTFIHINLRLGPDDIVLLINQSELLDDTSTCNRL